KTPRIFHFIVWQAENLGRTTQAHWRDELCKSPLGCAHTFMVNCSIGTRTLPMARSSCGICAPWAFGTSRLHPDRRGRTRQLPSGSRVALPRGYVPWAIALVRDRRLGVRRVCRVLLDAADEIERGVQRLVVLGIRRDIGLRAGLLVAFGLKVAAQRGLAARVGARLELLGHLLQHLDVGRNALRLDRASGRGQADRGWQ